MPVARRKQAPPRARNISLMSEQVLAAVPTAMALHRQLEADGYTVARSCRCHVHKTWDVTVRLVWRRRATGESVAMSLVCTAALIRGEVVIGLGYVLEARESWSWSSAVLGGER